MSRFLVFVRQHILTSLVVAIGSILVIASKIMEAIDHRRLGLPLIWWHIIGLTLFCIGIGAILYKWHLAHTPDQTPLNQPHVAAPKSDSSIATALPGQQSVIDKQAYNELVEFSLDCLLPACEAQMDLPAAVESPALTAQPVYLADCAQAGISVGPARADS